MHDADLNMSALNFVICMCDVM